MRPQKANIPLRILVFILISSPIAYFFFTPLLISFLYSPKEGDILFQSLNRSSDLVRAIEGVTNSEFSHCGIVVKENGNWYVNEAFGPVHNTPLDKWMSRGRGFRVSVFRLKEEYQKHIPSVISELEKYQGLPYDSRYRMDDKHIYCSELVYKAFLDATGLKLGKLETLGSLNWEPFKSTIKKYENGPVPLDRQMISPISLSRSEKLIKIAAYALPGF